MFLYTLYCTRFSDRVLIPHKRTRSLLLEFTKGLSHCEAEELFSLCEKHASFLKELVQYLITKGKKETRSQCPTEWVDFISALASSSPVCSFIHPSDKLFQTLLNLEAGQCMSSLDNLLYLQHEVPVLFELLHRSKTYPKFLPSVIKKMVERADAPFQVTCGVSCSNPMMYDTEDMAFFPSLPKTQCRGTYVADKATQAKICTKRRTGHPTLLPGLFTLFCKHGMCIYSGKCNATFC